MQSILKSAGLTAILAACVLLLSGQAMADEGAWSKAGKESKEAASAVGDAIVDSSKKGWEATKKGSEKAWDETKDTSSNGWDQMKKDADTVWDKAKTSVE